MTPGADQRAMPKARCAFLKSGLRTPKSCRILFNYLSGVFAVFVCLCRSLARVVAGVLFCLFVQVVLSRGNAPQCDQIGEGSD